MRPPISGMPSSAKWAANRSIQADSRVSRPTLISGDPFRSTLKSS